MTRAATVRAAPGGLCESCRWARQIVTNRGSRFLRCGRSDEDERFPKYPPLPVRRCAGYESGDPKEGARAAE